MNNNLAVVVGAGIAGMVASRVLCPHFKKVILVDKDPLSREPNPRKSIPQAHHVHLFLVHGRQILESFFPGFHDDLDRAGVPKYDFGKDYYWMHRMGVTPQFESGIEIRSPSRTLLETVIRSRLREISNVEIVQEHEAVDLIFDRANKKVKGVILKNITDGILLNVEADLIVDAGGKITKTPDWLSKAGYPAAPETIVRAPFGYSSRRFRFPKGYSIPWKAVYVQSAPPEHPRGGLMTVIEGNEWMVSASGVEPDLPPTDEKAFLDFFKTLRSPVMHEILAHGEPTSAPIGYRWRGSKLRHYEKINRWPSGFISLGDAVCSVNPIYAQGMTLSAISANLLNDLLKKSSDFFVSGSKCHEFQRVLIRELKPHWELAMSEDGRCPATQGAPSGMVARFFQNYVDRVLKASTEDVHIAKTFLEVAHVLKPPTALFSPGIVVRALLTKI